MNRLVIAALAILMLTSPAGAFIPPGPPPPELGWAGPGLFCGEGYTLKVEAGEFIREDLQLELSQPISNTVKSAKGWYSISVAPPGPPFMPPPPDLGALVSREASGAIYESTARYGQLQSFIFLPDDTKASQVRIDFWRPGFFGLDPDRPPQDPFSAEERVGVLERLNFGGVCPLSCLASARRAGECRPQTP